MCAQPSTSKDPKTFTAFWPSQPDWWTHATTGWLAANEGAHRACVEIARMPELRRPAARKGLASLQELTSAKAPDEVCNAWSRFWQTAAEDYGAEYSTCQTRRQLNSCDIGAGRAVSFGPMPDMPSNAA